jgi:predicted Zn-dependent peptidase
MGGAVDAMTGRESTTLVVRASRPDAETALDLLLEMVSEPLLEDVEIERQVILEELAMIEDDPGDRLSEAMSFAVFDGGPLGLPIAGTVDSVSDASRHDLVGFHRANYTSDRITVVAAGAVDHRFVEGAVVRRLSGLPNGAAPAKVAAAPTAGLPFDLEHPGEQVHIQIGAQGPGNESADRFAMRVLDTVFGGAASSRLFSELRDRRGLAYDTGSFVSGATRASEVGAYIATRPEAAAEAAIALGEEVARIRTEPPSSGEVESAKRHLRGRFLLSRESMSERAAGAIGQITAGLDPLSVDEVLAGIDRVSVEDVDRLAQTVFDPRYLHCGTVGPVDGLAATALASAQSGSLTA